MAVVYRSLQDSGIWADSGYWRDIQNAVDEAVYVGIKNVFIPEGTWNFVNIGESWVGDRVVAPAGMNFFGVSTERTSGLPYDGVGQNPNNQVAKWKTVLVMPWDVPGPASNAPAWFGIVGNRDPNKPSRFSDIKLVGYRSIDPNSTSQHYAIRASNVIDLRIDHSYLEHTVAGIGVTNCRGVIDHCYGINIHGVPEPWDVRTVTYGVVMYRHQTLWEDDVSKVLGNYTEYTIFIEDCYFEKWRHVTASNQGAHYVFRHCTIKDDYGYGSIDAHGGVGTETPVGTRATEIYNCLIINAIQSPWATFIRGGAGVAFNNRVGGGTYAAFIYFTNDSPGTRNRVNGWWIWNNTVLSGMTEISKYDPGGQVREGYEYFRHAPHTFNYEPYTYPHPLTFEEQPPPSNVTPFSGELEEGVYAIRVPSVVLDGSDTYNFAEWNDGSTNPTKTITLDRLMALTARYEKAIGLATLRGFVKDKGGTPLAEANVVCNGISTQTAQDGSYEFVDLEPKQYKITITKAGYQTQILQVDATSGGVINLPEIALSPISPISTAAPLILIVAAFILSRGG